MIVARLMGGLGNQLFQYALGRTLAARFGSLLRLDTAALAAGGLRNFRLGHFRIQAAELSEAERREWGLANPSSGYVIRAIARVFRRPRLRVVREHDFEFDAHALNAPADCYFDGYWQSPKYFESIAQIIRAEVQCREPLAGADAVVAGRIACVPAVAVHIRRGDYVSNPATNRYHGVCEAGYYMRAEALLLEKLGGLNLFVFSDDPDWVSANVRFQSPTTLVGHNDAGKDYVDLQLMSLCQHHIIANSTFSWWGAWLCQNPKKIVIAPRNWFREAKHSTRDLIPDDWIRI